jgi:uncharacterized protein
MPTSSLAGSRTQRALYLGLGGFFLALGVIGAFLPVIPTTGPLLVALWSFSKSSTRLHDWLYYHPRFGPPLQRWQRERVIPPKVKATAFSSMGVSFGLIFLGGSSWTILGLTAAFMMIGVVYIARCPSHARE